MEHNLTEQAIKDIQIVLSWLKNGSEMTPYNSIQRIIEQNALLRGIVDEKNKLLDDARAQEPCAYMFVDDLERFLESETFAQAYSIPVGAPDRGHSVPLYAAAPVPAQPAAKTVCDALEITNAIILDVCETDPADPSHPETVCINVDDLRETVERHILTAKGDGT